MHRMLRLTVDVAEEKDLGKVEKHRKAEGQMGRPVSQVNLVSAARISRLIWHCARPQADIYT